MFAELDDFRVQLSVYDDSSEDSDPICMRAHERGSGGKLLNNFLLSIAAKKTT